MHDHHDHAHPHDHGHAHSLEQSHPHDHEHDGHDNLLKSKAEAAAFLTYTLTHNAHHEEELSGLVHSLQHLSMDSEAGEVTACIEEIQRVNKRLEAVLAAMK